MNIPPVIRSALELGAALSISISGGKDSQAMLAAVMQVRQREGWPGPVFAIYADLGRMDWPQSLPHCQRLAGIFSLELVTVRRPQGDLLERMRQRMEKLRGSGKPFWPSAVARYCTNELKTCQIDRYLRCFELVISAEGIRAEESPKRSRKPAVAVRQDITTKPLKRLSPEMALSAWRPGTGRLALTWYPIQDWKLEQVWQACGTSISDLKRRQKLLQMGWPDEAFEDCPVHPAYVYGATRVSCALCVLASRQDLRIGALHNPELYQTLVAMERESGFTFQPGRSLTEIINEKENITCPPIPFTKQMELPFPSKQPRMAFD